MNSYDALGYFRTGDAVAMDAFRDAADGDTLVAVFGGITRLAGRTYGVVEAVRRVRRPAIIVAAYDDGVAGYLLHGGEVVMDWPSVMVGYDGPAVAVPLAAYDDPRTDAVLAQAALTRETLRRWLAEHGFAPERRPPDRGAGSAVDLVASLGLTPVFPCEDIEAEWRRCTNAGAMRELAVAAAVAAGPCTASMTLLQRILSASCGVDAGGDFGSEHALRQALSAMAAPLPERIVEADRLVDALRYRCIPASVSAEQLRAWMPVSPLRLIDL